MEEPIGLNVYLSIVNLRTGTLFYIVEGPLTPDPPPPLLLRDCV